MYAYFARLSLEDESFHPDEIADVEQTLEYVVVQSLVFVRTDVVAGDVYLYASFRVLYFCESCLTHHTAAHQSSCNDHVAFLVFLEVGFDVV